MIRADLAPGTIFRYWHSHTNFWVPEFGKNPPQGTAVSNYPDYSNEVAILQCPSPVEIPVSVNSVDPPHYKDLTPEPIDVTEGWGLNANLASVVWYIARAGRKTADGKGDLEKARRFLSREIARLDGRRAWE